MPYCDRPHRWDAGSSSCFVFCSYSGTSDLAAQFCDRRPLNYFVSCPVQVCKAAVEANVDVLVLCDTNGGSLPWEVNMLQHLVLLNAADHNQQTHVS